MYRVKNTHTAPVGIYDVEGRCVMVPPGKELVVNLTDAEAATTIRDNGHLKVSRERPHPPGKPADDGKGKPAGDDKSEKQSAGKKGGSAPAG